MKKRSLLKGKRGIAIESAVVFMTIVFSFCFLLTSLAMFGFYQLKLDNMQTERYVETEQIGEYFVAYMREAGEDLTGGFEAYLDERVAYADEYAVEITASESGEYTLTVTYADSETVALSVRARKDGNNEVVVTAWK